jgi:hypothetical protein
VGVKRLGREAYQSPAPLPRLRMCGAVPSPMWDVLQFHAVHSRFYYVLSLMVQNFKFGFETGTEHIV